MSLDTLSRIPHGYYFSKIPNESPAALRQLPVLSPVIFLASRHRTASLSTATQTDVITPADTLEHVSEAIGPRDSTANSKRLLGYAAVSASSSSSPDP